MSEMRVERDSMGEIQLPAQAYYGSQTQRAVENFPITGIHLAHFPQLIRALAMVKQAAARANHRLDLLPDELAGHRFYRPTGRGWEARIGERLRELGGGLDVESTPGTGTGLSAYLPLRP